MQIVTQIAGNAIGGLSYISSLASLAGSAAALYLEQQLTAFALGTRTNDTNMPMCTIAGLFTPAEMQSLAFAFEGSRGIKMKVSERCGRTQRTASAALSASVGGLDGNSFAESQQ